MGNLSFANGKFFVEFSRRSQKIGKAALGAGFVWDAHALRWTTRHPRKALGLRRWADESAELKLKTSFITELPPPEWVPFPDHLTPKVFQLESAWHALTRTPSYVADEAGLGKTITSVLCMNAVPGKTLIICPPFLKYNWAGEIERWCTWAKQPVQVLLIESGKDASASPKWDMADIVIVPDSHIAKPLVQEMIKARKWTWAFVDEAHRFKQAETQRTKALLEIAPHAERLCYLSGTPIPNGRPLELYPLLAGTAHESILWASLEGYGKEFCGGKRVTRYEGRKAIVNWDFSGSSNLARLRGQLRQKLMIRHLKRDVLKELGPKTRKIVFLDEVSKLKPLEMKALANHSLEDLMGDDAELGDIATYRREVGEAKLAPSIEYIKDLLDETGDKLVVFAHHIDVVEGLHRALFDYSPLMIRGGMKADEKSRRAKAFQTHDHHRVIVGNMEAMGVGLTLTKAPGLVVVEPSWVPGINEQAEDRIHRMTQDQNVYVRYLVLRNSLDERMLRSVLGKQDAINKVMD
jgi:SWI/SNF-related matrix-associated actin-dependent regulator 1 of chromatin subfamily A